jgi:hypothetical protein
MAETELQNRCSTAELTRQVGGVFKGIQFTARLLHSGSQCPEEFPDAGARLRRKNSMLSCLKLGTSSHVAFPAFGLACISAEFPS